MWPPHSKVIILKLRISHSKLQRKSGIFKSWNLVHLLKHSYFRWLISIHLHYPWWSMKIWDCQRKSRYWFNSGLKLLKIKMNLRHHYYSSQLLCCQIHLQSIFKTFHSSLLLLSKFYFSLMIMSTLCFLLSNFSRIFKEKKGFNLNFSRFLT